MIGQLLVVHGQQPDPRGGRGEQRVLDLVDYASDAGWAVRLHVLSGQPGCGGEPVPQDVTPDVAVLCGWQTATTALPPLRTRWPDIPVIVESLDLHFLRQSRWRFGILHGADTPPLDQQFAHELVSELNAYAAADVVLTVSDVEAALLGQLTGHRVNAVHLPLGQRASQAVAPLDRRSGLLFAGNFAHPPNGEAMAHWCEDIAPLIAAPLHQAHPLTVVGGGMDDALRHMLTGAGARVVGQSDAMAPHLQRARAVIAPILHGAGVKGKVLEAMAAGVPVITTRDGAEGLAACAGEHLLVASGPRQFAQAVARCLTDDGVWNQLSSAGQVYVRREHDPAAVATRFVQLLHQQVSGDQPQRPASESPTVRRDRLAMQRYRAVQQAVVEAVERCTPPGAGVAVISRGDPALLAFQGRDGSHFPSAADGGYAGSYPATGHQAVAHLCERVARDVQFLVIPATATWWLEHYAELRSHLQTRWAPVHDSSACTIFHHRPALAAATVVVQHPSIHVTSVTPDGSGLVTPAPADADHVVVTTGPQPDPELLASLAHAQTLCGLDVAAPALEPAPDVPLLQRIPGLHAHRVRHLVGAPVRCFSRRVWPEPTAAGEHLEDLLHPWLEDISYGIVDATPIAAAGQTGAAPIPPLGKAHVVQTWTLQGSAIHRSDLGTGNPQATLSVLVATRDRADLLDGCLRSLTQQDLPASRWEVVVVDDGSSDRTAEVIDRYAAVLRMRSFRTAPAGRAAAKNLAVLAAHGRLVLFFDDDDEAAPDLLSQHLRGHDRHPRPEVAVLGHTRWAPQLHITPVMQQLTGPDGLLFSYEGLEDDAELDARYFWEGRVSCKRQLLLANGLHDTRLQYSVDVELAQRLHRVGLEVRLNRAAVSWMMRPLSFEEARRRCHAKGRASRQIQQLHGMPDRHPATWPLVDDVPLVAACTDARTAVARQMEAEQLGAGQLEAGDVHATYARALEAWQWRGYVEATP